MATTQNPWRRAIGDPVYFARHFLDIDPHPGQRRWLRNATRPENLLHAGNRWGKSLMQAIKLLHHCIFMVRDPCRDVPRRYHALNVSITQEQAGIVFGEAVRLARRMRHGSALVRDVAQTPFPHMRFTNGAVLWARSSQKRGEYLLGHDYDVINFDECAFEPFPEYVIEEVLLMRLADRGGRIDFVSTPHGKGWFFRKALQLSRHPDRAWVQRGDSRDNPHLDRDYLSRFEHTVTDSVVRQNMEGRFIGRGDEVLDDAMIARATAQAVGLGPPRPHRAYVHGWDLARKRTYTVGVTLDVTDPIVQVVAFERFRGRPWPAVFETIRQRQRTYGGRTVLDATGLGDVVLAEVRDLDPEGFNFGAGGGRAKQELLANLEQFFARGAIGTPPIEQPDPVRGRWTLDGELREFTWEDNSTCDAAMALALALWPIRSAMYAPDPPPFRWGRF